MLVKYTQCIFTVMNCAHNIYMTMQIVIVRVSSTLSSTDHVANFADPEVSLSSLLNTEYFKVTPHIFKASVEGNMIHVP